MADVPSWVFPGADVWFQSGANHNARLTKIAKVHKTGRFTTEGGDQQYRVWGRGDEAIETGDGWTKATIYPDTPEKRAEYEKASAFSAAKKALFAEAERLEKLARHGGDDDVIAAAAALTEPNLVAALERMNAK